MSERERLSRQGPLPRPKSLQDARRTLKAEAFTAPAVSRIVMNATEFTSLCPRTGQPDFGSVVIEYEPGELCLESKALKYYLWAYRSEPGFCESLAAKIADDIVDAIQPKALRVEVHQNIRGGIGIVAIAVRPQAR